MITFLVIVVVLFLLYKVGTVLGSASERRALPADDTGPVRVSVEVRTSTTSCRREVQPGRRADDLWFPPGKDVIVHDIRLSGGMVYVGAGLASASSDYRVEPSLITPSLKVNLSTPNASGNDLPYWPSYEDLSPSQRGTYLHWLASGRANPDTSIGYVFLYFYGLERRLLMDGTGSPRVRDEAPAILAEVERLLGVFGDNSSFRGYATNLLMAGRLLYGSDRLDQADPPTQRVSYEMPLGLRVALGQLVADGKPITAGWALAWFMNHPDARIRTPAKRCATEFTTLFEKRFDKRNPKGLVLRENKKRLKCEYNAASAGIRGLELNVGDIPDVLAVSRPLKLFQEIADECMDALDSYSRYLGKNPDGRDSLGAVALLPAELTPSNLAGEFGQLATWIEHTLGRQPAVTVNGSDLLELWQVSAPKMKKREATDFAHALAKLGVGMEPDPRFGGAPLAADKKAVLFRLSSEAEETPSKHYRASTVLLHLASMVAAADGVIDPEEERHLEEHLERAMHMTDSEATRLRAHLRWLLDEQPSMAGIKKRLEEVDPDVRRRIGQFAVSVAGADGRIDPEEIKVLRKQYTMLGLSPDDVYGDIHELAGSPATEPVTVRVGKPESGFAIPRPPESKGPPASADQGGSFTLDMSRVEAKLRDTAEVAGLLEGIFAEDDAQARNANNEANEDDSADAILTLDSVHSRLLRALDGSAEMPRAAFDELATSFGLLPEGAIDVLNEAALESIDAPLLEGDDPVEIDTDVLTEMLQ